MENFCRVGHLFYRLKVLGEKNIEVGEQLYEDALREQLIREKLKQFEDDHQRIQAEVSPAV